MSAKSPSETHRCRFLTDFFIAWDYTFIACLYCLGKFITHLFIAWKKQILIYFQKLLQEITF